MKLNSYSTYGADAAVKPFEDLSIGLVGSRRARNPAASAVLEPEEALAAVTREATKAGRAERPCRYGREALPHADRHLVGIGTGRPPALATHFDFQMWPVYTAALGLEDSRAAGARPADVGAAFYWSATRLTRLFLDAAFSGEAAVALDAESAALPGVEVHQSRMPPAR